MAEPKAYDSIKYILSILPKASIMELLRALEYFMLVNDQAIAQEILNIPGIDDILLTLAGRETVVNDCLISFGENSNIGDITIKDAAKGNIFKLNIALNITPKSTEESTGRIRSYIDMIASFRNEVHDILEANKDYDNILLMPTSALITLDELYTQIKKKKHILRNQYRQEIVDHVNDQPKQLHLFNLGVRRARMLQGVPQTKIPPMTLALESENDKLVFNINKEITIIGRSAICDININALGVSRLHAVLENRGWAYYISDANSTNGTSVNSKLSKGALKLYDGDKIYLGTKGTVLTVSLENIPTPSIPMLRLTSSDL